MLVAEQSRETQRSVSCDDYAPSYACQRCSCFARNVLTRILRYEPYKGAKADGWRGFGKGLGKGFGHLLLPRRGLVIGGKAYGLRAIYDMIKKRMGAGTLSYILAANYAQGFEEVAASTEEERVDVLRRWHELAPKLKREQSGTSTASSASLSTMMSSMGSTGTSPTLSEMTTTSTAKTTSTTSKRRDESNPPSPSSGA